MNKLERGIKVPKQEYAGLLRVTESEILDKVLPKFTKKYPVLSSLFIPRKEGCLSDFFIGYYAGRSGYELRSYPDMINGMASTLNIGLANKQVKAPEREEIIRDFQKTVHQTTQIEIPDLWEMISKPSKLK